MATNNSKLRYERPIITKLYDGITNKFGTVNSFKPTTHIDDVAVKDIAAQYGSPCFVISEKTMRKKYREAYKAFSTRYPNLQFAWSYKTNYMNAVCNVFHQEGSWAEVVSGFEYTKALHNGVSGDKIIFNGPDKSAEDLEMAIHNASPIHIDHFEELYLIIELCEKLGKRAKVAIRINLDAGIRPIWDRFGFNYENGQAWQAVTKIMMSENLDLIGLHSHIGTFMLSADPYRVAAEKLCAMFLRVKQEYKHDIQYLDLGGGFASPNNLKGMYLAEAIPSFADYAEAITMAILSSGISRENLPTLILETGRAMIDEAGYLVGSIIANKRLADGRRATIMDFGVNLLFTSYWYNHTITPAQEVGQYNEDTVLYGPLCMNIDVVRETISLPPMERGDLVVVHKVGAYNMTQWMQFITYRPKIVMIDLEGKTHIIRQNENLEYIMELESVPEHLKTFEL